MSLSVGIVGLPNVGKSTLFNALTKQRVLAANYPFATIEPNVGIVNVPDERLVRLAELYKTEKIVPAAVSFVDIAGLVRGASQGQGLGNQFLANIRGSDAICQVVRAFSDPDVTHVAGATSPKDDIETINTELILADLQSIDKKREKTPLPQLAQARRILDSGQTLCAAGFDATALSDFGFLTAKPFIYVFNLDEKDLGDEQLQTEFSELVSPAQSLFVCAKIEAELADLPDEEAAELLRELGQDSSGLNRLINAGYTTLGLQTFLTAGPKEVRAWTVRKGATAPEAAGVIHTDFERGFIRAEVINYSDLINAGSVAEARSRGQLRSEGRDYVMREDDVVEFRFNV